MFVLLVFPVVVTCAFFTVGCSIDRVHFFVNAQLDSDSAWDFFVLCNLRIFFLLLGVGYIFFGRLFALHGNVYIEYTRW